MADDEPRPIEPDDAAAPGEEAAPERSLILLPVRNTVLFPEVVLPLVASRAKAVAGIQEAARAQLPVGVVLQRDPEVEDPSLADLYPVGTLADILRYVAAEENLHHVICRGRRRFRIVDVLHTEPYLRARCELVEELDADGEEVEARAIALKERAREALELLPGAPEELAGVLENLASPGLLADMVTTFLDLEPGEKQEVLETEDVRARLELVASRLEHRIQVLELSQEIRQRTKGTLDKAQREFLLRQQLETIQKELQEIAFVAGPGELLEKQRRAEALFDRTLAEIDIDAMPLERLSSEIRAGG